MRVVFEKTGCEMGEPEAPAPRGAADVYFLLVAASNLVTALVPSETACLASCDGRVCGLRGAAQRRAAGAILMQRSIAALWRVARARGGRGWLLVGLEDAGTRGGVTRRVTKCDVLELKSALRQNASTKCSSEA